MLFRRGFFFLGISPEEKEAVTGEEEGTGGGGGGGGGGGEETDEGEERELVGLEGIGMSSFFSCDKADKPTSPTVSFLTNSPDPICGTGGRDSFLSCTTGS